MKTPFLLALAASLAFTASLAAADAANAMSFPPLKSSDIPRNTQIGTGTPTPGTKVAMAVPPAGSKLPTLWVIGDSTVRNGSYGDGATGGQWGWGAPFVAYFDATKINVINRAMGGTSSRSYYEGLWKTLTPLIKKGDYVILQFGANDNAGASLKGTGDETQGNLHSFGWYITQFVKETHDKGGIPIICSLTPRNTWAPDGVHFKRDNTTHAAWAAEIAKKTDTAYVDLYELIARKYEQMGKAKEEPLYADGKIHTSWDGAVVNAERVVSGLNALKDNPLAAFLSPRGNAVAPVDVSAPAPAAK